MVDKIKRSYKIPQTDGNGMIFMLEKRRKYFKSKQKRKHNKKKILETVIAHTQVEKFLTQGRSWEHIESSWNIPYRKCNRLHKELNQGPVLGPAAPKWHRCIMAAK